MIILIFENLHMSYEILRILRCPQFRHRLKNNHNFVREPNKQLFVIGLALDPKTMTESIKHMPRMLPKITPKRSQRLPQSSQKAPRELRRASQEPLRAPNMAPKAPKGCPRCLRGPIWVAFWLHFDLKMEVSEPILTQIGPQLRTPDV